MFNILRLLPRIFLIPGTVTSFINFTRWIKKVEQLDQQIVTDNHQGNKVESQITTAPEPRTIWAFKIILILQNIIELGSYSNLSSLLFKSVGAGDSIARS